MPNRTRRFQTNRRTPNRSWAGFASTAETAVAASTKVLLGSFTLSNSNIDETILRNVGVLGVTSDQIATTEVQIGAFGMIVVNDLAVAAGAASIPGPITDRTDDGWFVYVPIVQKLQISSNVGNNFQAVTQYQFDSKAKRVVQEGFQIALMVENASSSTAFDIMAIFRTLSQIRGT